MLQQSHGKRGTRVCIVTLGLLTGLVLSGCAKGPHWNRSLPGTPGKDATEDTIEIKVYFDASGCPQDVRPRDVPVLHASAGDKVEWVAYRGTPEDGVPDDDIVFAIYFDPFVDGKPLSSRNGKVKSTPVNRNTPRQFEDEPEVHYKYSILGEGEDCVKVPLDPRLRVMD